MRLLLIKCVSLERETENVRFPNCGENQENGDSTRTKKLQLQCKLTAKVPFRRVRLQFTLQ